MSLQRRFANVFYHTPYHIIIKSQRRQHSPSWNYLRFNYHVSVSCDGNGESLRRTDQFETSDLHDARFSSADDRRGRLCQHSIVFVVFSLIFETGQAAEAAIVVFVPIDCHDTTDNISVPCKRLQLLFDSVTQLCCIVFIFRRRQVAGNELRHPHGFQFLFSVSQARIPGQTSFAFHSVASNAPLPSHTQRIQMPWRKHRHPRPRLGTRHL